MVNWRTWPLSKTNFPAALIRLSLQLSSGWNKTPCRVQACLRREVTLQPNTTCFNQNAEERSLSLPRNGFSPRHWRTFINFLWLLPDLSFFTGCGRLDLRLSRFVCELSYLICKLFLKLFRNRIILAPFVFKMKMWLVLRTSFGVLLRILLRTTDGILNLLFELGCYHAAVIGSGTDFNSVKLKFTFFSSRLLCSFLFLQTSR